jgi:hypothetical protein
VDFDNDTPTGEEEKNHLDSVKAFLGSNKPNEKTHIEILSDSGMIILARDSKNGLLRVRQKAMRVDSKNGNKRIYPRSVVVDAISRARPKAHAGVMLSEFLHPSVVLSDGSEEYVDNPDRKTASVDEIHFPDSDGWVWIDRTVKDTQYGKPVADAILTGSPFGLSTRFKTKGSKKRVGGEVCFVADWLDISTWDDVSNPAVLGAGEYQLLTDSEISELSAGSHKESKYKMFPEFTKAYNRFINLITARASVEEIVKARKACTDAMQKAEEEDDDGEMDMSEYGEKMAKADEMMRIAGYHAGSVTANHGSCTGSPAAGMGYAPDVFKGNYANPSDPTRPSDPSKPDISAGRAGSDGLSQEEILALKAAASERVRAESDAKIEGAIREAAEKSEPLRAFSDSEQSYILAQVKAKSSASKLESVPEVLKAEVDSYSQITAKNRLASQGYRGVSGSNGVTVSDTPHSPVTTRERPPAYMEHVDRLCAAADEWRQRTQNFDPSQMASRRKHNRKFIEKLLEEEATRNGKYKSLEEKFAAEDALLSGGEKAFMDCIDKAGAGYDSVTISNMLNQPTISSFLIVQTFQDMEALQFVDGIGPGLNAGAGGWELTGNTSNDGIGSVLKIPVETYTPPTGSGVYSQFFDGGLLSSENAEIDEATVNIVWLPFAPSWRRIGISPSREVIKAMGNGPLNYPVVARSLYNIAADKSRRIDRALLNEMIFTSDEVNAVSVSGELISATNYLAQNTVGINTGVLTVNLNPAKAAVAAVAAGDPFVTYGSAAVASNIVGAIRLKGPVGGIPGSPSATAPAFGSSYYGPYGDAFAGGTIICRPRVRVSLSDAGAVTTTTDFAHTFVNNGSTTLVLGYIDDTGNIQNLPGGGTANAAVDYERGLLLITAALAGGTASAQPFTATGGTAAVLALNAARELTMGYWYATNYDQFPLTGVALPVGVSRNEYLDSILAQVDKTAAFMGSYPRFVQPNMAIVSLNLSAEITPATIFYNLNSPKETELYPTDSFFAARNGVGFARINAPWAALDKRILVGRRGATKYGIDTAFELRGPYMVPSNGKMRSRESYYGEENSVICTPQVKSDPYNNPQKVVNPVYRTIAIR